MNVVCDRFVDDWHSSWGIKRLLCVIREIRKCKLLINYRHAVDEPRFKNVWMLFASRLSTSLGQLTPSEIVTASEEIAHSPLTVSEKQILLKDACTEVNTNTFLVASLSAHEIERLVNAMAQVFG